MKDRLTNLLVGALFSFIALIAFRLQLGMIIHFDHNDPLPVPAVIYLCGIVVLMMVLFLCLGGAATFIIWAIRPRNTEK